MCSKRQQISVFLFIYFSVSVSPWLSYIHYVYKVPNCSQRQFFCNLSTSHICPLFSPLIVGLSLFASKGHLCIRPTKVVHPTHKLCIWPTIYVHMTYRKCAPDLQKLCIGPTKSVHLTYNKCASELQICTSNLKKLCIQPTKSVHPTYKICSSDLQKVCI